MTTTQTSPAARSRHLLDRKLAAGIAAGLVVLVAAIAAGRPSYAVFAAAPFVGWFVWRHAAARLAFVVAGGLLVFHGGTDHLTPAKVGYFAAVALAIISILRQRELYADLRKPSTTIRTLAPIVLVLGVLVVLSLAVAHAEHTGLSPWLRDSTAYGLVAVVPLFLWDFERNASRLLGQVALVLLVVGGVLSALSLGVQWLGQRGLMSTTVTLHILPGGSLSGALALFLAVRAGSISRHRVWYVLGALAIPLGLFLTGTRQALLLLVCVAVVLFTRSEEKRRLLLGLGAAVVVVTIAVAALVALGHSGHPGVAKLTHRITSIPHTVAHPNSDPSYRARANEWHVAWRTFKAHPILGVGPGHTFTWNCSDSGCTTGTASGYNLDSPLVYLAKFGLLGLVGFAVVVYSLVHFLRARRETAPRDAWLALTWYLVFVAVELPFGWPFEAKDFTLGLLLLGALVVQRAVPTFAGLADDWPAFREYAMSVTRGEPGANRRSPAFAVGDSAQPDPDRGTMPSVRGSIVLAIAVLVGAGAVALSFALSSPSLPEQGTAGAAATVAGQNAMAIRQAGLAAAAQADARLWGYSRCGGTCRIAVKPLSAPVSSLWEIRVNNRRQPPACFLLDVHAFKRSRAASALLDRMHC
jgi:O-antigen ligase